MALSLVNLDEMTRKYMLEEFEADKANQGQLFISKRLTSDGKNEYISFLKQAIISHDDEWLANKLFQDGIFKLTLPRETKKGYIDVKVPHNANETLAEGEFNRYYIRGICRRAINENIEEVEVYRAKNVSRPRQESQAKIGTRVNAQTLLNDLRENLGVNTALGLPAGPNSGLSVKFS